MCRGGPGAPAYPAGSEESRPDAGYHLTGFPPPSRTQRLELGEDVLILAFIYAKLHLPNPRKPRCGVTIQRGHQCRVHKPPK